ncbi:MAG: hypothetical protein DI551_02145 [Micavibrio aeruginosavorus]|uniref:Uncharacterized protein n=1 Tax=Micavibrio aeruginosavorus TaxID=349221 RepID=A0A2W5NBJ4_9BACT|nr:MAG: hypothetical protein DI551_02145 [Micavibrio aeruginosavorus]
MRLNRYLTSTLLAGLFATVVLSPAMGQEQSMQPKGAWSVAKVDRMAQGGNSYCTLSRKYDDGVVLSLGRSQTEEYSLAIDFQKDVFKKDQSLKISLQPGPGQIRAYDMMPASEKAMVIRLGWDTGFFDTLNKSQLMKVKIADKSYAFAMPEIAKGQGDLSECMDELKSASNGGKATQKIAQTKDVLNAEPVNTAKEFNAGKVGEKVAFGASAPEIAAQKTEVAAEEKSILQGFADSIRAQEPTLRGEDEAPKRRNFGKSKGEDVAEDAVAKTSPAAGKQVPRPPSADEPVEAATATAKADAPELVKRPSAPDSVLPAVKPDSKAQTTKLTQLELVPGPAVIAAKTAAKSDGRLTPIEEDEEMKAMQKRMAELANENQALKQKTAAITPEAQKQLDAVKAQNEALAAKLEAEKAEKAKLAKPEDVAAAQTRAKELEIKNAQLEDSLRQSQVRIGEAALNTETKSLRKIADLEVKLEAAQKDNNALAKQLESMRVQQEDKGLTAVAGDWDLEQATKRFNEAEREIRRLGMQLEQERTSCNREKAEIEQMLFDPAVADKQQIEKLSSLQDQLDEANSKLGNQQKMVQDQVSQQVAAQVAQKTQALEAEKAASAAQLASLQKSVAATQTLQADNAKLIQQVADLQKAAVAKDAAATGEKAALQSQLQAQAQLQKELQAIKVAMAQKDQELAVAKTTPKADPAQAAQLASVHAQLTALQTQNKAATDSLASKDKALADAQAALKVAQTAAAAPKIDPVQQKQMASLNDAITSIKADNDALRDQNIVLRSEADKLRIQLSDVQNNGAARADKVASIQLDLDNAKRQMATKDTQLATYQNQLASLQQESTQLKNRLAVADSSRNDGTAEVGALTRQIQQLQNQVSTLQSERSASASSYASITPAAGSVVPSVSLQATAPVGAALAGYDGASIKTLLQRSGLAVGGVSKTSGFPSAENFGWTDGSNVKGTASVKAGGNFDALVSQYIAYQKQQCGGDFASMPSPSNSGAAKRMALYEVACVSPSASTSSSLIFFEDQGRFIAIANQTGAADMDVAMDSRDKIAGFVRGL